MGRLSASAVKTAMRPGRVGDGDGLFLVVSPSGAKSWVCRVQRHGNRRDFGLGSASKVSLAVARDRAREVRAWIELGLDPVFERRKMLSFPTFREAAAKVLAASKKSWRNAKHEGQWLSTVLSNQMHLIVK
ncbi:MAG: Arm DNA-binding domain-containing protein [Sphingorhabdus sp.]